MTSSNRDRADVVVIGDGVIGLSVAIAVARSGGSCHVVGKGVNGQASSASAGLLAPSLGASDAEFRAFMRASRDRYPDWLHWLAERTGIEVTLNRRGILEIDAGEGSTEPHRDPDARELDLTELDSLEPALARPRRATLHSHDGYVDNVMLLRALREALRCEWSLDVVDGRGASVEATPDGCSVRTEDGRRLLGGTVVIAAGAWSALVAGLPRHVMVEPVRGQMLLLEGSPLEHAVASPDAYLVPRDRHTLIGSTLERVGFDNRTTATAREHLRAAAVAAVPEFEHAQIVQTWAGLRPMTSDGLPILGRDPDVPGVVYACGHGKNGILLAPLTAECIASVIGQSAPPYDLSRFSIERFV